MKTATLLVTCIFISWGLACAASGDAPSVVAVACKVPPKAEPFDLADVKLLDGPFKHAQEINRQLLVNMDFDWLMHPFRQVAGLPTSVACPKLLKYDLTGHTAGHYLSACALHYRNTNDDAVKRKADDVVAEMARCQAKIATGFLGGFPERSMQVYARLVDDPAFNAAVPWYCLHKIYAGLLDMYVLTGNRQALEVLMKVVDWTEQYTSPFSHEALQGMLRAEHGGICELWANLYAATGDARCLRLAQRFVHQELVAPAARGEDLLDGKHANTQIPKFSSVARLYPLDGNPTNLLAAANFWTCVVTHHSFATGGNSYAEAFRRDLPAYLGTRNSESCNEYNMLKLTRTLFNVEPLAAYADYYERTLYNHVLSSRHPQTGGQLYFQPLQSGHIKGDPQVNAGVMGWRFLFNKHAPEGCRPGSEMCCCSGSGLESNAKYADSIYFHHADKDLYVNLFIPSTVEWKSTGIKIRQETRYPEQAATMLLLECRKPVAMTLHLRRPSWATEAFEILVNGARQEFASSPGSYVRLVRIWQSGDTVEVHMPMRFRMEGFTDQPTRAAVMYGPLVMAAVTGYGNPFSAIKAKNDNFLASLQPVEGKSLEFTGAPEIFRLSPLKTADQAVIFRPLYQTFETPYAVYWDVMEPTAFLHETSLLEAELRRLKELEPRTVDWVLCYPGNEIFTFQSQLLTQPGWLPRPPQQISERAHGVKDKKNSRRHYPWRLSEMFFGYKGEFRFLEPDTWCSYRMKVCPDREQTLEIMIWKSASNADNALLGQGRLEVVANGQMLGTCEPSSFSAGQFTKVAFPLPAELIKARKDVEILLRVPEKSKPVGGIYECRMITKE